MTSYLDLQNMAANNTNSTNTYNFTYTVVIAPDSVTDKPSPIELVGEMVNSTSLRERLAMNLPTWDKNSTVPYKVKYVS